MNKRAYDIRVDILIQLYGYRPLALSAERMAAYMRSEQNIRDVIASEIERELAYLKDKGHVVESEGERGQVDKRYAITAAGIDWMEKEGWV